MRCLLSFWRAARRREPCQPPPEGEGGRQAAPVRKGGKAGRGSSALLPSAEERSGAAGSMAPRSPLLSEVRSGLRCHHYGLVHFIAAVALTETDGVGGCWKPCREMERRLSDFKVGCGLVLGFFFFFLLSLNVDLLTNSLINKMKCIHLKRNPPLPGTFPYSSSFRCNLSQNLHSPLQFLFWLHIKEQFSSISPGTLQEKQKGIVVV